MVFAQALNRYLQIFSLLSSIVSKLNCHFKVVLESHFETRDLLLGLMHLFNVRIQAIAATSSLRFSSFLKSLLSSQ